MGSGKNYSIRIVAFSLLLQYRISSFSLLIEGNYSRAFGFPSAIRAHFAIIYTPLQSFISFLTVYLYSFLASRQITLFFLLYATLQLIQLGTNQEAFYAQEAYQVFFTTFIHSSNYALEAYGKGHALGTIFTIVFLIAQYIASASTSSSSLILYRRPYRGQSRPSNSLYTTF